jgi:hypothetical protein
VLWQLPKVLRRLEQQVCRDGYDRHSVDGHVDDQLASSTIKFSANGSADVGQRLRELAHIQHFSESSIVDVALKLFFAIGDDAELETVFKRQRGARRGRRDRVSGHRVARYEPPPNLEIRSRFQYPG